MCKCTHADRYTYIYIEHDSYHGIYYTYIYTYRYTYLGIYYICIHLRTHARTYAYAHARIHAYVHTFNTWFIVTCRQRFIFLAHTFRQEITTITRPTDQNILSNTFSVNFFSFFSRWLSTSYELFSLVLLLVVLLFVSFYIISSEHQTRCGWDGKRGGVEKKILGSVLLFQSICIILETTQFFDIL